MKTKTLTQEQVRNNILGALLVAATLVGCGRVPNAAPVVGINPSPAASTSSVASTVRYKQIERLARPAINEGLVYTNAFLNAYNSIAPSIDLTQAASSVVAEAAAVLGLLNKFGRTVLNKPAPTVADVAAGFLPDVMRIDTSNSFSLAQSAYNGDFTLVSGVFGTTSPAILTGGRKIQDDVMDITLSYLLTGNVTLATTGGAIIISDGVSYDGGTDCSLSNPANHANPGHRCLIGQNSRTDPAIFPFLAQPN